MGPTLLLQKFFDEPHPLFPLHNP